MSIQSNPKEKNLLDLGHSLSQTKGALFLSIGIGGGIAIFFGGKGIGVPVIRSFIIAVFFTLMFVYPSIKHFSKCSDIQDKIKDYKK